MGKKYIIDLNPDCVEGEYLRIPARIAGEEQWLVTKAALTPYTEPDLEQVRLEAEQLGMVRAWGAARKICCSIMNGGLNYRTLNAIFGSRYPESIIAMYTAAEAIEKLKAYEQEQEEIKVGDEVTLKCGVRPAIYMQGTKGSDEIYLLFNDGSCGPHSKSEIERKTGRHFHEIAEVLAKMKETDNG